MKIVLLMADVSGKRLSVCRDCIIDVLQELDVEVDCIDLSGLPYYKNDEISPVAILIADKIEKSKGIIALTSVSIVGMHSSMQSFFEHMIRYITSIEGKPLLSITYTAFQGERQAAYQMLQTWSILGGKDGGSVCLNKHVEEEDIVENIERNLETYYRLLKQDRAVVRCSEHYLWQSQIKNNENLNHPQMLKKQNSELSKGVESNQEKEEEQKPTIDLSTKEQNIKDLTYLLKQQLGYTEEEREFVELPMSPYTKPRQQNILTKGRVKLSNIPHYFIAQHDKTFQVTVQYILTDTQEKGMLFIKDGDCTYEDGHNVQAHIEMLLNTEILEQILRKQLTYQKAFMIGKLKVKGNFGILAKLDQSFKEM